MFIFFLITLAFSNVCTFDENIKSYDFLPEENYHERYCDTPCPCSGDDCTMDFTNVQVRNITNATGEIGTLITKDYEYTFSLEIPSQETLQINKLQIRSYRTHFKLGEESTLIVKTTEKDETYEHSNYTTLIRCNTKCTIKDSEFVKEVNDSISFISNKDEEGEIIPSTISIENVKFHVQHDSDKFNQNYVREKTTVEKLSAVFVIDDENIDSFDIIPLFYASEGFAETILDNNAVTVESKADMIWTIKLKCDNKWIVAIKGTEDKELSECYDPTITDGDVELADACETAFIVIICLADTALAILLVVFAVLALIPVIKKKRSEKYTQINE